MTVGELAGRALRALARKEVDADLGLAEIRWVHLAFSFHLVYERLTLRLEDFFRRHRQSTNACARVLLLLPVCVLGLGCRGGIASVCVVFVLEWPFEFVSETSLSKWLVTLWFLISIGLSFFIKWLLFKRFSLSERFLSKWLLLIAT